MGHAARWATMTLQLQSLSSTLQFLLSASKVPKKSNMSDKPDSLIWSTSSSAFQFLGNPTIQHCTAFQVPGPTRNNGACFAYEARQSYFIAMPWGRAGPVLKAVSKSKLNRLSSVRVSCVTLRTWTLWSPSK
jgi:hypothetical protein